METPYVHDFSSHHEFDTIYHEHLFYYSLTALEASTAATGWPPSDVERIPIHGGSLRVSVVHQGQQRPDAGVRALLEEEAAWGVSRSEPYRSFAQRVVSMRDELRALLVGLKAQGKRIAAYGAAAKGSTLLHYMGIDGEPHRLRGRSQPAQAGALHAGQSPPDPRPGEAARRSARTTCCS